MSAEQTKQAQDKINQMTRIIAVMTPEDKTDPAKLSAAARGRVAAAAGVPVAVRFHNLPRRATSYA
jgi:signal recognition particle GTPase